MKRVYICSPYRAKDGAELDRNIEYAQALTKQALNAGLAPITPHLYMTQCLDDKKPQKTACWRRLRQSAKRKRQNACKSMTTVKSPYGTGIP